MEQICINRVHVLWWNQSAESWAAGRHWSHEDPRVGSCHSGKCQLPRVSAEYVTDSTIIFTIEVVSYLALSIPSQRWDVSTVGTSFLQENSPVCCQKEVLIYFAVFSAFLRLSASFTTSSFGNISVHVHIYWISESIVGTPCSGTSLFHNILSSVILWLSLVFKIWFQNFLSKYV